MEYEGIYDITRKMHVRPLGEVTRRALDLIEESRGLIVTLINEGGDDYPHYAIMSMMTNSAFPKGEKVRVIAEGDLTKERLKYCADEVGKVFSLEDLEPAMGEVLYDRYFKPES